MKAKEIVLALCFFLGCACTTHQPQPDALQKLIDSHPEIILQALEKNKLRLAEIVEGGLIEKAQIVKMNSYEENIKNPFPLDFDPNRPILGEKDAPLTVIVYSDFLCPHCSQAAKNVRKFLAMHKDNARMQYKHLPLSQLTFLAAEYYEAVGMQDHHMAWLFHDRLFENQEKFAKDGEKYLLQLATDLQIDTKRLANDIQNKQIVASIKRDIEEAKKVGVSGTPTMFINGVKLVGSVPIEEMEYLATRVSLNKKQE
jgi:protein-disulfide isomerase